jgi:hypothetical protein
MNKIIMIILMSYLLVSCEMGRDEHTDNVYGDKFNDIPLYDIDNSEMNYSEYNEDLTVSNQIFRVGLEIMQHVSYLAEPRGRDVLQTPEETWELKTGDCEDLILLMCSEIYFELGYELTIALTEQLAREVVDGGDPTHVSAIYGDTVYSYYGYPANDKVMYKYSFWHVYRR